MRVDLVALVPDGSGRILTSGGGDAGDAIGLPATAIEVEDHELVLRPGRGALAYAFGIEAPVLEVHVPADAESMDRVPILFVLEPPSADWPLPEGLAWRAEAELDLATVAEPLRLRLSEWLSEIRGATEVPALRPAWARPGWYARVCDWLDTELLAAGRPRIGPVEQVRQWGISALLRCNTDAGSVWVKAAYPPFRNEPRFTGFLASRFPMVVPRIVAANLAEGWLAMEDFGRDEVGDRRGDPIGRDAVRLLARMQRDMAADLDALRAAGAADRGLEQLADDLAVVFAEQPPPVAWPISVERRAELVQQIRRDAEELRGLGIPPSLVHGDFHPWNVAVVNGRPVIFDWTDTTIGHPLLDFAAWVGFGVDAPMRRRLWADWVAAWSDVVDASELVDRYYLVLGLGSAFQVVSYAGIVRNLEPAEQASLSHGTLDFAILLDDAVAARSVQPPEPLTPR